MTFEKEFPRYRTQVLIDAETGQVGTGTNMSGNSTYQELTVRRPPARQFRQHRVSFRSYFFSAACQFSATVNGVCVDWAEFEREVIRERVRAGLDVARARGKASRAA
jgi:hypothetical protein